MVNITLALAVQAVIDRPEFAGCRWGVTARRRGVDLGDGALLYENPGAQLFTTPASNNKLPTAYAAWLQLGPSYTFDTFLGVSASTDGVGVINYNVTLCGAGDPSLTSAQLTAAADQATDAVPGLKNAAAAYVTVRVDDRRSGDEPFPDSWEFGDLEYDYGAPPAAIILDANTVTVRVSAGAIPGDRVTATILEPGGEQCFTVSTSSAFTVGSGAGGVDALLEVRSARLVLSVRGSLLAGSGHVDLVVACRDPLRRAGMALVSTLKSAGVPSAHPAPEDGTTGAGGGFVVSNAPECNDSNNNAVTVSMTSARLDVLLNHTLLESDNTYAEAVLRRLGDGGYASGLSAVRSVLGGWGLDLSLLSQADGSGLTRHGLVTSTFLAALMSAADEAFVELLPLAGETGTLSNRFIGTPAYGKLRAKTGGSRLAALCDRSYDQPRLRPT